MVKARAGKRAHGLLAALALGLIGAAGVLGSPGIGWARRKEPRPLMMAGVVTAVEPNQISIRGAKGKDLIFAAPEDFTEKVAVGAQVTAGYYAKDGVNALKWLDHPLETFFVPAREIRARIKKIIILSDSKVGDADLLFDGLTKYLESKLGWYIAPRALADEIRNRAGESPSTLEAIDPASGRVDMARYLQHGNDVVKQIASETRVDAVLEATLESVQAKFRDQYAAWDGVEEQVGKWSSALASFAGVHHYGEIPAATLELKLRNPEGKLLWIKRRGFTVLAVSTGRGNEFRERPLTEVFQDPVNVERWVAEDLGSLVVSGASDGERTTKE